MVYGEDGEHLDKTKHFILILTDPVEDATEFSFFSFESHRIDLDTAFHMYQIELFDSAHRKFDL